MTNRGTDYVCTGKGKREKHGIGEQGGKKTTNLRLKKESRRPRRAENTRQERGEKRRKRIIQKLPTTGKNQKA